MRIRDAITGALQNWRHHKAGRCVICGRPTVFVCTDFRAARNNMVCVFCHCSSRQRHVAKVLLEQASVTGGSVRALASRNIHIYDTDSTGALSRTLSGFQGFTSSGLFPDREAGERISDRVYNQNLEALTFEDGTFDFVISEDVFEHVRRDEAAFKEVWRVLKPGGYHLFTVPFRFDRPTLTRVDTSGDEDVHILPPEYHGDKIRGRILAYRTYGVDLYERLQEVGFETTVTFSRYEDRHRGIFDSHVFVSKKV